MTNFITALYSVLAIGVTSVLGFIGKEVITLAPQVYKYIVDKRGLTKLQQDEVLGKKVFNSVEEDGRLGILVVDKITAFGNGIRSLIPAITDEDVDLLRQSIAGEFNATKSAVVKEVQAVDAVAPVKIENIVTVKKYYNDEGIELVPVTPDAFIVPDTVVTGAVANVVDVPASTPASVDLILR